ncbi:MAG: hypothetical protein ACN4GT_10365 [Gammaproteobacteria bacterium]
MKPNHESFEETQSRILGTPPGMAGRLAILRRRGKLLNVLIPSLFVSVVLSMIARDVLADWNLPDYVFVGAGIAVFVAMFGFLTVQETTDKKSR